MKNRQQIILEHGIYLIIWLILFVVPIFGYRHDDGIHWSAVWMFWIRILPFALLFALNNYLLIPRLLVMRKYSRYLLMALMTIVSIMLINQIFVRTYFFPAPTFRIENPKTTIVEKPNADTLIVTAITQGQTTTESKEKPPRRRHYRPEKWHYVMMDGIVSLLLVGTNAAICLLFLSMADRKRLSDMESQSLKAELDYLKAQINPHFFMNTLNNIHALVDIDSERAKESIIELSKIMRYVLYDTNLPLVSLTKEVEFINNYVDLMRMRYSEEVLITMRYPDPLPELKLPPLMLVALIENAFKHGISYQHDSFVEMSLEVVGNKLIYKVENSYFGEKIAATLTPDAGSGVGLTNLRKRLGLLYGDDGQLLVAQTDNRYTATLTLTTR